MENYEWEKKPKTINKLQFFGIIEPSKFQRKQQKKSQFAGKFL